MKKIFFGSLLVTLLMVVFLVISTSSVYAASPPPDKQSQIDALHLQLKEATEREIANGEVVSYAEDESSYSLTLIDRGNPSEPGALYKLPDCDGDDPNAPCYIEIMKCVVLISNNNEGGVDREVRASTQTLRCGINVYNSIGQKLASLWEDVNVTTYATYRRINWTSKGTWVKNGLYEWTNLIGPTVWPDNVATDTNPSEVKTTGTLKYLGIPWGTYVTRMRLGHTWWHCYSY